MPKFEVVELPCTPVQDIPAMLRNLANRVESGDFGTVANIAYVMDIGEGSIDVGLMGQSASPGTEAYFLLACGQKHILREIL